MNDEYVVVGTASGMMEAELIRGLLESNGIDALLMHESASTAIGLGVGPLAEVDIRVAKSQEEAAKQILDDYYSGRLATDD
ncbi:MAG: hypothetical protein GTO18_16630 [Anaerolineales bacterium]|nr:hypothetical protein [Anaerolineales bacterium]